MAGKAIRGFVPKLVLITGASQGLGAELSRAFARAFGGVKLALVARNEANLEAVVGGCEKLGARSHGFVCDVAEVAAVGRLPAAVRKVFGRGPDVVVNNAGAFAPATFAETSVEVFDAMLGVNLRSAFLVTKAFLPEMLRRGFGDVVFVSSVCGQVGLSGCAAYTAAKHGLSGLAAALRTETKGSGVRVMAVHPGAIDTPIWKGASVPKDRLMTVESVAEAVVGLVKLDRNTVVETATLRPGPGDL